MLTWWSVRLVYHVWWVWVHVCPLNRVWVLHHIYRVVFCACILLGLARAIFCFYEICLIPPLNSNYEIYQRTCFRATQTWPAGVCFFIGCFAPFRGFLFPASGYVWYWLLLGEISSLWPGAKCDSTRTITENSISNPLYYAIHHTSITSVLIASSGDSNTS